MDIIPSFLFPLCFFCALVVDRVIAARPQPKVRGWTLKGVAFFFMTAAIRTGLPAIVASALVGHTLFDLSGLGTWAGAMAAILATSFFGYWTHRLSHRSQFLWRWAHQLHHSAERLDIAGFAYTHPFDSIIATVIGALVIIASGVTPEAAAIAGFAGFLMAMLEHLNVRTPVWLGYVVQRPEAHAVHHQRDVHAYNYGLPLWDMVFGTWRNPREVTGAAGFWDGASSRVLAMLLGRDVSTPRTGS